MKSWGLLVALFVFAGAATAWGGSGRTSVDLQITVRAGLKRLSDGTVTTAVHRFRLRCDPSGGDVPSTSKACSLLRDHERLMLRPPKLISTCIGGIPEPPVAVVRGVASGHKVHVSVRACDQPAGRIESVRLWLEAVGLSRLMARARAST